MQTLNKLFIAAAIALMPAIAMAQSSESLTRAQVNARLVQLEKAGYNPYTKEWLYPNTLQRAEATAARQETLADDAYGSAPVNSVESGK